jgi:glucosamine--fructose-6-phosphate aminotransferase (isomerizing)
LGVDGEYIENLINLGQMNPDIFEIMDERVKNIECPETFKLGIGHTRWATHGGKTDYNSHPHVSSNGKIKLVHNGIISNFYELKTSYLFNYKFNSSTDTEVIANMIQYLLEDEPNDSMCDILKKLSELMEGTWACIIHWENEPNKLYFIKNENPLLIGRNESCVMFTSEPSGFMNSVSKYYLLKNKTFGWVDTNNLIQIYGDYTELNLIKCSDNDINLPSCYKHWMYKEILDQTKLNILTDPITGKMRYNQKSVLFDFDYIKPCKYLYIIACGSSYYAGVIAANYFRYTRAFEFVNVIDGGEFTKIHLESIENPEENLLVLLISQSGETRDLDIATTICREFSTNRKNILKPNHLLMASQDSLLNLSELNDNDSCNTNLSSNDKPEKIGEIKIIGVINVIGSLISRRTIDNIYTNCGRENAVASTKSCTSQILACLLLAIYKSQLNKKLGHSLKNKFMNDLNSLETDICQLISREATIELIANQILSKNKPNMFLLGKDELYGSALEGALKIKEIAYIHAEGFNISTLKHGPYALIETDTPIIVLYKERNHFVKSIIEEIKTRGAFIIEMSPNADATESNTIVLPPNRTFTGLLAVIALQLLSYFLSVKQNINPDRPRNLAKVVTVD